MMSLLERARARRRGAGASTAPVMGADAALSGANRIHPDREVVGAAGRDLIRHALDRLAASAPPCRAALGGARREMLVDAVASTLGRAIVRAWDWALDAATPHIAPGELLPMPQDSETLLARLTGRLTLGHLLALDPDPGASPLQAAMLRAPSALLREAALDYQKGGLQTDGAGAPDRGLDVPCRDWAGMRLLHMLDEQGRLTGGNRVALAEALLMTPATGRKAEPAGEAALLAALQEGDTDTAADILAASARLPRQAVDLAAALRAPRVLVSIAWRAGLRMDAAEAVQAQLGRLPEALRLKPSPAGDYPLSEREMAWQIGLLTGG